MTLFKIPLLFIAGALVSKAATPPAPPPKKDEQLRPTFKEYLRARVSPLFAKTLVKTVVAVESICILISSGFIPKAYESYAHAVLNILYRSPTSPSSTLHITPSFIISLGLIILGGLTRWSCYRALGRFFTFQVALLKDHRLITDFPYNIVRHPGYFGVLSVYAGISGLLVGSGSWGRESGLLVPMSDAWVTGGSAVLGIFAMQTLFACVGLMRRVRVEDEMLHREFGKEWEMWRASVKWAIVPGVY